MELPITQQTTEEFLITQQSTELSAEFQITLQTTELSTEFQITTNELCIELPIPCKLPNYWQNSKLQQTNYAWNYQSPSKLPKNS